VQLDHVNVYGSSAGLLVNAPIEQFSWSTGFIAQNKLGMSYTYTPVGLPADFSFYSLSWDDNTTCAMQSVSGAMNLAVYAYANHFENVGGGLPCYGNFQGPTQFSMFGGQIMDDRSCTMNCNQSPFTFADYSNISFSGVVDTLNSKRDDPTVTLNGSSSSAYFQFLDLNHVNHYNSTFTGAVVDSTIFSNGSTTNVTLQKHNLIVNGASVTAGSGSPSGNCPSGNTGIYMNNAASTASTVLYVCESNTWTAVGVP